jgi:hypothetical protein
MSLTPIAIVSQEHTRTQAKAYRLKGDVGAGKDYEVITSTFKSQPLPLQAGQVITDDHIRLPTTLTLHLSYANTMPTRC